MLNRVTLLRRLLAELQLDAICCFGMPSVRYLCGFTGSDGVLVVAAENTWFLTDSRYTTQAEDQVVGAKVLAYKSKLPAVAELLQQQGCRQAGFDATQLNVADYHQLTAAAGDIVWQPLPRELESLRICKEPEELALLAATAQLSATALAQILARLRVGMTERELAVELEYALRRLGADGPAFDFIVASGERGALPHGCASHKLLQRGELVTIDYGAVVDGYCSDETITIGIGCLDQRQRDIYEVVRSAQARAIDAIRPGVPLRDIDAVARTTIAESGFADYFGHGLGHGVGLEVHEAPVVSPRSESIAEEGMVFTVEPGIYIPGWGGVRIEDMVAVTADGCRLLTCTPKQLAILDI